MQGKIGVGNKEGVGVKFQISFWSFDENMVMFFRKFERVGKDQKKSWKELERKVIEYFMLCWDFDLRSIQVFFNQNES